MQDSVFVVTQLQPPRNMATRLELRCSDLTPGVLHPGCLPRTESIRASRRETIPLRPSRQSALCDFRDPAKMDPTAVGSGPRCA